MSQRPLHHFIIISALAHIVLGVVLFASVQFTKPERQPQMVNTAPIQAVTVDRKLVEKQLRQIEDRKKAAERAEQRKLDEQKRKLKEAEDKRKAEEARIKKLERDRKRKEAERKKAEQEAKKAKELAA
ncbi:cell envelope integrity protein TolA, partial [Corallincola platygyrae]